jgi:hypothetical protein
MAKFNIPTREEDLLTKYGLTEEAYQVLLQAQNYVCKICGLPETNRRKKNLSVDHDHVTGRVRGLLCSTCNVMLGMAKEDQTTLLRAIQYLKGKL